MHGCLYICMEKMKACLLEERKVSRWGLREVGLTYQAHRSFSLVNVQHWKAVVGDANLFLSPSYLTAVDLGHPQSMTFILFYRDDEPVGVGVFHEICFISGDLSSHVNTTGGVEIVGRTFKSATSRYSMLVCGNPHCTGEHGYYFKAEINAHVAMQALCAAANALTVTMRARKKRAMGILIKDFYPNAFDQADELKKCGFHVFQVDNQNRMQLADHWSLFDDYLNDLNTKFRTKVKAVLNKSTELNIREWHLEDMQKNAQLLQVLYRAVYDRADFAMEPMSMEFLLHLKMQLKERMLVQVFELQQEVVGFQIGIFNGPELEAFAVGIDYAQNQQHAIYGRMLVEFIQMAINRKCRSIAFGRTASEMKSTFGAFPVKMKVAARHPGFFRNMMLTPFFRNVHPADEPQRFPFKGEMALRVVQEQKIWNNEID